jgi:hypothetical protein
MTGTETRTLDVTQEDIGNGKRGSARKCPFALAAQRLFPGWSVTVVPGDVHLYGLEPGPPVFEQWDIDAAGKAAVVRYDTTGSIEPGSYTLTLAVRRLPGRRREEL